MKVFRKSIFCAREGISETTCSNTRTWPDECDGVECIDGEMVGRNGQHYVCNDEWCEEVAEQKPLVLKLFFSPEYNITFTEHNVNPDVGFETGKYYRFIGKESSMRLTLWSTMRKILEHNVLKCTNGSGRNANFEGIGDISNEIMYTWISKGSEKEEFKYWKEMRPLVVVQAPDIITFDELCTFNGGSITGEFTSDLKKQLFGDWGSMFDAVIDDKNARLIAKELSFWDRIAPFRSMLDKNKEITKMKVDKHFAFKKKFFGTTLHEPKVVKTHKYYANDGACEACGATINKGDFVLTANETDCNKVTKKTHRLCASCTAEYLKAKSCVNIKSHNKSYIEEFEAFVRENNVKEGTRIRITKDFGQDFNAGTYGHTGVAGRCGTVSYVGRSYINVRMDGEKMCKWSVPYYAMEVIKESNRTYKPITGFETGKWYVCHFKKRPHDWNSDGKMDGLLDGKPHKCTFGRWVYAEFEDIPSNGFGGWRFGGQLCYFEEVPSPVKSYSERQAEWIKENNVTVGTKVRVTRGWSSSEEGCCVGYTPVKKVFIGDKTCTVRYVDSSNLTARIAVYSAEEDDWWYFPYFVLEVVNEPTYEERQAEWIKKNNVATGTKVRITRAFSDGEDGIAQQWTESMGATVGKVGVVERLLGFMTSEGNTKGIRVDFGDCKWWYPYTVLEIINEPTYAERQAEWVAKNNIKVGTKVRFTKGFNTAEDGSGCCEHRDAKGVEGFVSDIEDEYLFVRIPSGGWAVPFTAIEVVPEEPWFKIGDKVRITIKSSEAYNKIGMVTNIHMHKDGTQTVYMSFEEFRDTKAFNADSKEKIGVLYTPTYEERQAEWIKKHNLKEGDKIAILRTAKGEENGWNNSWTESMNSRVGSVFTYGRAYPSGISLSCGYNWPYFVLGVVKE